MVIDYNRPWHILNFDVSNAIKHNVNFNKYEQEIQKTNQPKGMWVFQQHELTDILNKSWLDYFESTHGIIFDFLAIFYRTPFYTHPQAHIDTDRDGNICIGSINWTLDSNDDSSMDWYHAPITDGKILTTSANTKYISADMSHVNKFKLGSRTIAQIPTLVNVGIFHNVTMRQRPRWAISVRPRIPGVKTWDQMVEFFKPWIVNPNEQCQ